MTSYELAQVNVAWLKYPLEAPEMKDFTDNLDSVNADAEAADGFVWRLLPGDGEDHADLRFFGEERLLPNMSVWRDSNALTAFMYQGTHRGLLARRFEFFERPREAMTALWWVPSGHRPTIAEAEKKLTRLRELGPTPEAFTLGRSFPPPGA
ncbi:DUF3291 domain-containing protein [Streptomyces sp. NPDC000594]|uniref:DUF3291 domain-containing protein n=1 Tax=Streptomyces sp. NPDC000594 TaxID=3154261 RepID=UPI00332E69A5